MARALRFVTFDHLSTKSRKIGVNLIHEKQVLDLTSSLGIRDMRTLLEERSQNVLKMDDKCLQFVNSGKNRIPLADVRIRAPM